MEVDKAVDVYGDWHRQFMQALLSRPVLSADELRQLASNICGDATHEVAQLKTFLKTLREKVQPLGLDLKKGNSEHDGKLVYALINTSGGEETAACAGFTEPQLRFLRAVVEEVVTSVRGDISQMDALHLADGSLSKADAQTLMERLLQEFWLEDVGGRVALHTRCILELEPYLKQHYGEHVASCPLCNRITVRGQTCEHVGCNAKYHRYCLTKMRRSVNVVKCRSCQAVLPSEESGDGAARER